MEFESCRDERPTEATKNIRYAKGYGAVEHNWVTRWFFSGCKNLNVQARSGRSKTVDSEAVLESIVINPSIHLPNPPHEQDATQGQFLRWSLTGLNSRFSFSQSSYHSKVKETSQPFYLSIAVKRIVGRTRILVNCKQRLFTIQVLNSVCCVYFLGRQPSILWTLPNRWIALTKYQSNWAGDLVSLSPQQKKQRTKLCRTLPKYGKIFDSFWYYLQTPPLGQDMIQGQFLSGV